MGRRLAAFVHVHGDDGVSHVFGPGSVLPAWAAARVTNPKAWDGTDDEDTVEIPVPAPPPPPEGGVPPRHGPKATRKAWADHALALGVDHPAEASRDEIIAAVDERGR